MMLRVFILVGLSAIIYSISNNIPFTLGFIISMLIMNWLARKFWKPEDDDEGEFEEQE